MVNPSDYMRNKESGEVVRVYHIGALVAYRNADVDGEVQAARLAEHFDVLPGKPADAASYF